MFDTNYTPGEWRSKDGQVYSEQTGSTLAITYPQKNDEEQAANANIMASAPALFKSLETLVDLCESIPKDTFTQEGQKNFQDAIRSAWDAMQKATNP
ncbi:MAG: hypothetical protein IM618_11320 [Cytophagales bacterium]|jgi:hypothetical protein|nr:hypothetical protein [Cytophagales bacterium]